MKQTPKIVTLVKRPLHQVVLVVGMIIVFTLIDLVLPHPNTFFEENATTWIMATAMILCFVILNTLVALMIEKVIPYWSSSVIFFLSLFAFSYGWCFLLTGRHIDDVGSIRWLWMVLIVVYMIFFAIAVSMRRIIEIANKEEERSR